MPARPNRVIPGILAILGEGSLNGTPKLGLLLALLDVADDRANKNSFIDAKVTSREIALAYLDVYWDHTALWRSKGVLRQLSSSNREHKAIVICSKLQEILRTKGFKLAQMTSIRGSLSSLGNPNAVEIESLIHDMERDLWKNPVIRLQSLGGTVTPFLYEWCKSPREIHLKEGVLEELILYSDVLRPLIEQKFSHIVESLNYELLGLRTGEGVYDFLFKSERVMPSKAMQSEILDLQEGRCLWTGEPLQNSGTADHVVPWSRLHLTVAENFVIVGRSTNSSKGALPLSPRLLERYLQWMGTREQELRRVGSTYNFPNDLESVISSLSGIYNSRFENTPLWNGPGRTQIGTTANIQECITLLSDFEKSRCSNPQS